MINEGRKKYEGETLVENKPKRKKVLNMCPLLFSIFNVAIDVVVNDASNVADKLFEHTFEGTDKSLHPDTNLSCLS